MDFVKNINADRENTDAFTEKLWMGIQNGDKDCYEKLFNEYSDKMLAYGMKYRGCKLNCVSKEIKY